jgi:hypothetical protein
MLIGGPAGQEGKVGFFEPKLPSHEILEAMSTEARTAVEERARQRREEYDQHKTEYDELAAQGLIRVKDGVLQVADPRAPATEEAPHGEFKDVGGDIDIFDITHADGSPLTDNERAAITKELRSMGINVEHGFHTAWRKDSPETYSPEADANIRAQHTSETPLVAFIPKTPPREVWATDVVHGPERTEGPGDRFMPLKGAKVTEATAVPPKGAPGTGPDIKPRETDFGDIAEESRATGGAGGPGGPGPGGPGRGGPGPGGAGPGGPGRGGGGGGPSHGGPSHGGPRPDVDSRFDYSDVKPATPHPGEPGGGGPGAAGPFPRPAGFPDIGVVQTRLQELLPQQVESEAVASALLLLEGDAGQPGEYVGRSGAAHAGPRSDLTEPARRIWRPETVYPYGGADRGLGTEPVRGAPGANTGVGPLVQAEIARLEAADPAEVDRRVEAWRAADEAKKGRPVSAARLELKRHNVEQQLDENRVNRATTNVNEREAVRRDNPDFDVSDVGGDHGYQPGSRAHDAEANLLEQLAAELQTRGELPRGELHVMTNYPTCPACVDMIFRLAGRYPSLRVYIHTAPGY